MIPSIYINLEDDVSKIIARIKKERSSELILVCPKRCFLFNDSINLRLLKKQADLLLKKVYILTMDERGQGYAKEAGFELKHLPKAGGSKNFSDIRVGQKPVKPSAEAVVEVGAVQKAVEGIKNLTHSLIQNKPAAIPTKQEESLVEIEDQHKSVLKEQHKKFESIFPPDLENSYKTKKRKKRLSRITGLFTLFAFTLLFLVVFVFLPKADIVIYSKTQSLTRDLVVSASTQVKQPDSDSLVLPAEKISQAVNVKSNFQSQGKKEVGNKASGSVVIYNFTGAPINLKAKTTTIVLNGKNYLLKADAMQVKPTKYKNSKTREIDESSLGLPVEIEAALGGESYNVPAGTRLELTNQVFGSRPQLLYVKASSAITGGTSRYLSLISAEDVASAKLSLQKLAWAQISEQIKTKNLVLDEKAFLLQNPQFTFDHDIGTETPEFNGNLTAQVVGFAYGQSDLETIVLERIKKSLTSQNEIDVKLGSPLTILLKPVDFNQELVVLEVHFEGVAVAVNKNLDTLPKKLAGKSQNSAAEYIKQNTQTDKVEITLLPGWQRWLPWLSSNIHIGLK